MTTVLVLDPDVDALGRVGEQLSKKGLTPVLAQTIAQAEERARARAPRVLLVASSLVDEPALGDALARSFVLAELPRLVLVHAPKSGSLPPGAVGREDGDRLVARVLELAKESELPSEPSGELRGDIAQAPLVDVVQLLAMNQRTGTLLLRSTHGTGELRLDEGEIVDAVFRHLEGEKALYRILLARDGAFSFAPSQTRAPRRIQKPTSELLMEAMRQKDEMARLVRDLGDESWFVKADAAETPADELERALLAELAGKRSLGELLDDTSSPDLDVMEALKGLVDRGAVERSLGTNERASLAPVDQLPVLRSLAGRLARRGFPGIRVAVLGPDARLATLGRTLVRGLGAQPPADPAPGLPLPHEIATVLLGDGISVSVLAVPDAPHALPLATLALPSVGVLVRLVDAGSPIGALARELGLREIAAESLCPDFDEADPAKAAVLLRLAIEEGAGA